MTRRKPIRELYNGTTVGDNLYYELGSDRFEMAWKLTKIDVN